MKKECYEEEVQPYRKTDYKPMIYISLYCVCFIVHYYMLARLDYSSALEYSTGCAKSVGPSVKSDKMMSGPIKVIILPVWSPVNKMTTVYCRV